MFRRIFIGSIALLVCLTSIARAADNGNGTYTNPPLYADFPDPDIIRVGSDYYMVSTTFVGSPGLPVLHSKDLVNWSTVSNVVSRLEGDQRYNMTGGNLYRNGIFAPSIRYNNGTFYVAVQPNGTGQGLQIYHSQDPAGPWQLNQLTGGAFDPGLFFDNGTPYVIYGGAFQNNIFIRQLSPNLDGYAAASQVIHSNTFGLEGAHVIKRGSYYYMFHARPSNLSMYVSRSTNLFSGWTSQLVINDASRSGHQGGMVDLPSGDWYGFAMLDSGPIGRVTNIGTINWVNDWPVWGINNVIPATATKPIQGQPIVMQPTSTGFDEPTLPLDWRWNHNPDDTRWSLTERPGYLRLKPTVAPDFWNARNTLTYKGFGPQSEAVVELDISNLQVGDSAGLGMLGKGLANLTVRRLANGQAELALSTGTATASSGPMTQQTTTSIGTAESIFLLLRMNFQQSQGRTAYSLDGENWEGIGNPFTLQWDWATGTFQGEQYALFNFNAAASTGYVDANQMTLSRRGDFDRDGDIDADDYLRLRNFHLRPLVGDSPLETYTFGDADGDLDNDFFDFRLFQADYTAAHGEAGFAAVLAAYGQIPEPGASTLLVLGLAAFIWRARWRFKG